MPGEKKKNPVWPLFTMLALLAIMLALEYKFGTRTFVEVVQRIGLGVAAILSIISTFVAGTFLYFFRCRWPFSYGVLEIIIGVFGAFYVATQLIEPTGRRGMLVFAEIAALYVIVRGWDNVARSLPRRLKQEWDEFFFGKTST